MRVCDPATHADGQAAHTLASTISQSSWLTSTHGAPDAASDMFASPPCAATRHSRASVAEMTDVVIAMRGPILRMFRPTGDMRIRVSMAVRYRSGSRFFVRGNEGRSGSERRTGASGDEHRGCDAVRREVKICGDEGLGAGTEGVWMDGVREGAARRFRMRTSYLPNTRLSEVVYV